MPGKSSLQVYNSEMAEVLKSIFSQRRSGTSTGVMDVFNVRLYGAVGDGTTNDYAAIQAAFDACKAASNGGNVYFPPGVYYIGNNSIQYVHASHGCIISGAPNYGQSSILGAGSVAILDLSGTSNCKIENIYLVGDAATPPQVGLLLARYLTGGTLYHCATNNFTNVGTAGCFSKAAVYSIGAEVNSWYNPQIYNTYDGGDCYCFYTSTENDLSVTPSWGTIPESADGVTNSVGNIYGGILWNEGTTGVSLALCGLTGSYNFWGTFITSLYRPVSILPSSASSNMNGPNMFSGVMLENGLNGHYQIYIGAVTVYYLDLQNVYFQMGSGTVNDYGIYADTGSSLLRFNSRGCRFSVNNGYAGSIDIAYYSVFDFNGVADGKFFVRTSSRGNTWHNFTPSFSGTSRDRGSIRDGVFASASYEQRIHLGPLPISGGSSGSSDDASYAALQYHPSAIDKAPAAADIGLITAWDGTANNQPGRHIIDKDGNHVPSLWLWTGYRYVPISSGRKEIWQTAQPADGLFQVGDMCWHTDATVGQAAYWQCVTAGGAHMGTWSSLTTYSAGQWVLASDSKVYKSIQNGNLNHDPNGGGSPTWWTEMAANEVVWGTGPNLT